MQCFTGIDNVEWFTDFKMENFVEWLQPGCFLLAMVLCSPQDCLLLLLYNVYVLYSSMEEQHLAEWGSLNSNQINQIKSAFHSCNACSSWYVVTQLLQRDRGCMLYYIMHAKMPFDLAILFRYKIKGANSNAISLKYAFDLEVFLTARMLAIIYARIVSQADFRKRLHIGRVFWSIQIHEFWIFL